MTKSRTTLMLLCVAGAVLFCSPTAIVGFSLLNFQLRQGSSNFQRDVRVFDNWLDNSANNNNVQEPSFPGYIGADLAVWKAAAAWSSQSGGNRAFDFDWQGDAPSIGGLNTNTLSSLTANCGGGTLAFAESPDSAGWRIRFCEEWTWDDGPVTSGNRIDLQGVATHELGHALGLGHTGGSNCSGGCASQATMCPSICGNATAQRSITSDDRNGLGAIYGTIGGSKPVITGIAGGNATGETLIIDGMNFSATVNVKFTAGTSANAGAIPGVIFSLSSTNGGTRVEVVIPPAAESGNVFVWQPGTGGLSNYFPISVNILPPAPTSITPTMGGVRGGTRVTLFGANFSTDASVTFDGQAVTEISQTESEIVFKTPAGSAIGAMADVTVSQISGMGTLPNAFAYVENQLAIEFLASGGVPTVGGSVTITAYGTSNRSVALAVALPGMTSRQGLDFCVQLPVIAIWKFSAGLNTGPLGEVSVVLNNLPGPVFTTFNITGVERFGGNLTIIDCTAFTVF